jgi:hypothetical protein
VVIQHQLILCECQVVKLELRENVQFVVFDTLRLKTALGLEIFLIDREDLIFKVR